MNKLFALMLLPAVLGGCQSALMNTKREIAEREQRIAIKEQEVQSLKAEDRQLMEEQRNLLVAVDSKQMTLDKLYIRVEELEKASARAKARTASERNRINSLNRQMKKYKQQISALRNNDQLSGREKKRKIEALKQELKLLLELGLKK